jgi:hypothetical protein
MQSPSARTEAPLTASDSISPTEVYAERAAHYAALRDELHARSVRNGNLNVALFFGALLCAVYGGIRGWGLLIAVAVLLFLCFIAAFARQGRLDRQYQRYRERCAVNEEGSARLARDWEALPLRAPADEAPAPPLATDLDLLGRASLQHLLSAAMTAVGQATLREWLLAPAPLATIRDRQASVAELAPQVELREELAVGGRLLGEAQRSYLRFLEWAEGTPWLRARGWLVWLTRALTALTLLAIAASAFGWTRYPLWLGCVMLNVVVTALYGKPVEHILDAVAERQRAFDPYADLYHLLMTQLFNSPALRGVRARLTREGPRADAEMRRLGRIMQYADLRLSMFFPIIQALLLWTFHVTWFLEGWQRTSGPMARDWLLALGEADALAGLAALLYDHPDWSLPEFVPDGEPAEIEARELGHPLLASTVCVRNDVTVGPPGALLLVTGSNMSGKSTLLRALGTNVVLAQAGGPVCAASLRLPPVRLATSIRVQDSLEQGVSYFMAELRRLKEIVDLADAAKADGGPVVCYLLDEILHGTNTSERQIAARRILAHLLAEGAIGAVSTHDLTLADTPEITAAARQVHFTEAFTRGPDGPAMSFDYTLRPGLATSTNALKLMEIVGLEV